jgi:hypothetical protein
MKATIWAWIIVLLIVVGFALHTSFTKNVVCGYDGRTYSNVYVADKNNALVQSFGQCVQVDVITIINATTQTNPVAQSTIGNRIGLGIYQLTSYPFSWFN